MRAALPGYAASARRCLNVGDHGFKDHRSLPEQEARRPRWTRTRTVCTLIVLSLTPGLAAAAARDWWHQLPAGVRMSAYILSAILLVAACSLLLLPEDSDRDGTEA